MRKLLLIAMVLPLLADDRSKQTLSATHTDNFQISAPGVIRLENSFGEVDIDGWDRPEVQITVVRSTEHLSDAKDRVEEPRRLDRVQVAARQNGNDVVISTTYPPRNTFLHPLSRRSDIEVTYAIKAPRASKLLIAHQNGGVSVSDISGEIHATATNGQITLTLPDGQYAIDAQATAGDVYSDFDGREIRRNILGEEFARPGTPPATKLYLRVRLGDIMISKMHGPPAE